MNRTFYLIAFVLVFGIGMLVPAVACKCGEHPVLDKQQCDLYNVIFKGKVDSISGCRDGYATAYFRIQELYKGKSLEQVSVRFDCESDCQLSVGNGEEWLVYARYFQYNKLDMVRGSTTLATTSELLSGTYPGDGNSFTITWHNLGL